MHRVSKKPAGFQYAARNNIQESPGKNVIMKSIVTGVLIAVIITGIGILAGAWMLDQQWLAGGDSQYVQIIWGITAVAVGCGAFCAAMRCVKAAMMVSLMIVAIYIVLRIVFSILYGDGTVLDAAGVRLAIMQTGAAVLCGMIGRKCRGQRL